jgi:H+/gluconate symporter-like permease
MVFAIKRFDVEGVIKIWAMLGVLVGIVTGTFGTYFFTRQATEAKIAEAQTRVTTAEQQTRQTANQLNEAALQIASKQPALAAKVFGNNYIAALQTRDLSERAAAEASAPAPSPQILYNATNAAEK